MTNKEDHQSDIPFLKLLKSPWRFKLFLLKQLPMAFLAGLRVAAINTHSASISVSLRYLTKNPFRSIYFACLAMAAELSTGVLAMMAVKQSPVNFSFLVVEMEASFVKKAIGMIIFECNDGKKICQTLQNCICNNEAKEVKTTTLGKNEAGETVASFNVTWSFKPKNLS